MLLKIIDVLFLIDIIVTFNTAFYTESLEIIDDRRQIAKAYVKSWFFPDLIAILPLDLLELGSVSKISRIGKITRLARLVKLLRIMKLFKHSA